MNSYCLGLLFVKPFGELETKLSLKAKKLILLSYTRKLIRPWLSTKCPWQTIWASNCQNQYKGGRNPPRDSIKINVDAAFKDGSSSIAVVARDCKGEVVFLSREGKWYFSLERGSGICLC